jgi:phage-related protein
MDGNEWKIKLYQTYSGESPVKDFIDNLELRTQAKVYATIELLKQFGISIGSPHVKKLTGTSLWELRILGSDNTRIFYIACTGKVFLLLHGFKKKKNKTDRREIKIAEERLKTIAI